MMYDVIKKCPLKILPGSLLVLALLLLFSSLIDAIIPARPHIKMSHELNNEKPDDFDKDTTENRRIGEVFVAPQ